MLFYSRRASLVATSVVFTSLIPAVLPIILKPITMVLPLCSLDLSPSTPRGYYRGINTVAVTESSSSLGLGLGRVLLLPVIVLSVGTIRGLKYDSTIFNSLSLPYMGGFKAPLYYV